MFIVWGSRGRSKSIEHFIGHCPDCGARRDMDLMQVKRWFTLYWIRLFPYSDLGRYVECASCKSTFNERMRDYDPEKQQEKFEAAFSIAAKRVMFKLALADGDIDPSEVDQITQAFQNIAKRSISRADIAAELEAARDDTRDVAAHLAEVAPGLNDTGKELVLRSAIAVVKADGRIDPEELTMLRALVPALDLPRAYANGIFAEEGVPGM